MKERITIEVINDIKLIKERWLGLDKMASALIHDGKLPYILYSFYQTYGWNSFLYQSYRFSAKKTEYIVVSVDGEIKMIVPLLLHPLKKKMTILSGRIAGILNIVCPYQDKQTREVMTIVTSFIKEHSNGWKYKFHDMPLHASFLEAMIAKGIPHTERGSYHVPLSAFLTYEDYLASLGKNIYKNIRKAYNHLATDGKEMSLRSYTYTNPPSLWLLCKVWTLYFRRKLAWKKKKDTFLQSIAYRVRAFLYTTNGIQTKSMRCLKESELFVLTINGKVAAFMHIYVHDKHILMPKLAIDASYSRYSPGILLLQETLKVLMERGMEDFDMCRGDERYKMEVGGIMEPLGTVSGRF